MSFQLLGITIRADIPMGLDLSPSFWKTLVGLDLDPVIDIKEADPLTYSYMKKIEVVSKMNFKVTIGKAVAQW